MIGVFDYTVVLTYMSLVSAFFGILFSLSFTGCPYIAVFFLLFCGLCDAFDGKVASMKKSRTDFQKKFGIQIDSLSDLVAFGVLPACIGIGVYRSSYFLQSLFFSNYWLGMTFRFCIYFVGLFYVLAALIRLAYFNVTEEERQKKEKGKRKMYTGLPVTASCLIFPSILLLQYIMKWDLALVYVVALFITSILFLLKFQIKKLEMKEILILVFLGLLEFIFFIFVGGRV